MRTTRPLLLTAFAALSALFLTAGAPAQSKTGTTVGQFLLIEPSGRLSAMGNAGVSSHEDITSVYYNPAALGHLEGVNIQFSHSMWIADIAFNYASAAIPIGTLGSLFLSVTSLNSGEIDVTTVSEPLGTGERYTVSDLAFGIGFGRQVSERFSVGVQVSYLQETIWRSSLSAFALNVGTIYRISPDGLHIGASISNFGTRAGFSGSDLRVQYDQNRTLYGDNSALPATLFTEDYPLPVLFRVGLSMPLQLAEDHRVIAAVDAYHPSDNDESVSAGLEYTFMRVLSLRGGYQNMFLKDSEVGLTLGAGLQGTISGMSVRFDYGWADHGLLNDTQRLTLGITF
jgi:long-subunit fatty acid transport protein